RRTLRRRTDRLAPVSHTRTAPMPSASRQIKREADGIHMSATISRFTPAEPLAETATWEQPPMARHLITSALPYINGIKHLGNMVGSMLPADVYSRYLRQRGHEVLYICATDEHGTPAELAAKEAGQSVAAFCAEQHDKQKAIYEGFGLRFDYFGR